MQKRVVAFAPFIEGMALRQLELVVAPPVEPEAAVVLLGIEACASSHHWSRELQALGPTVRLMPPAYVKPYVKRHKNDSVDAEAICEDRQNSN